MGKTKGVKPDSAKERERQLDLTSTFGLTPSQPSPGDIFEDITEDGYLDVILDDQNQATYVCIESYNDSDGPGSGISEARFSAVAGNQSQAMLVQSDPDFLGLSGDLSICNRYLYYSQVDSAGNVTESGFSFGAYTYEDYSFGSYGAFGAANLAAGAPTGKVKTRGSVSSRGANCRSEGLMPIRLTLTPNPVSTTIPIFSKPITLYHSRSKITPCSWFSRAGISSSTGTSLDAFFILQKVNPRNWSLVLRSKLGDVVTYVSATLSTPKTPFATGLTLPQINSPPDGTYPPQVTIKAT